MNARDLTKALGGHWHGKYGTCRCPAHDDRAPSLSVSQGQDGTVLVKCFAGCNQRSVIEALKARGLWGDATDWRPSRDRRPQPAQHRPTPPEDTGNTMAALDIWRACQSALGTLAQTYLRARGITLPPPPTIRFNPNLRHAPTNLTFPALVAAIQTSKRRIGAVHRTFLMPDGSRKAGVTAPKMALGHFGDGAVRLAAHRPVLGLAEGIETGLSAMQLFTLPVWVACGSRLHQVALPPDVHHVVIFGDNGAPGHQAAEKAAEVFEAEGRTVTLQFPPEGFGDWNDVLKAEAVAA